MPLFVYPVRETAITLRLVIFSWNQRTIINTLGIITTRGITLLSIEIHLIIVRERRLSSTPIYISLILISTTTSSPIGYIIRAPFLSMLYMYFLLFIPVNSKACRYSFLNQSRRFSLVYISTR